MHTFADRPQPSEGAVDGRRRAPSTSARAHRSPTAAVATSKAFLFKVDGDIEAALHHSQTAVRLAPEQVSYLDTLGWINWKGLGNIDEAERLFRLCRKFDQNEEHHASLTALGEVMVARKQFQKAEKYYRAGLKLKPDQPYKLLRMAELYCYHLNEKNLADGYCRHVLRLDPDNAEAKRIQADC
ncbi:MAG: hypothetical protein U0176_06050 [Bacteroidia bacterium]